jgi:bacterioferritin
MKGNKKIIETLNTRLGEELTAIHQYVVHSQMVENWGYSKLSKYIMDRAKDEMRHAEMLMERIVFLEGAPDTTKLGPIAIGPKVPDMFKNDHSSEVTAIKNYNESIKLAVAEGDNGTREILESILRDEEGHIDAIEANLSQLEQMGTQIYLAEQLED